MEEGAFMQTPPSFSNVETDVSTSSKGLLAFWLRLTTPRPTHSDDPVMARTLRERERRSRLISFIIPFVFFAPLFLLQQAYQDIGTAIAIILMMPLSILSLICNRFGKQTIASLLLLFGMEIAIEGSLLGAPGGLGTGWLLTFDLFIFPLFVSAILLSRFYLWFFLALHCTFILGDVFLLKHTADISALIAQWNGPAVLFARPLILQLGIALLSALAVSSMERAIERADNAEELVALERAVSQERKELEEAAFHLRDVHAHVANGHYKVRANVPQGNALWEVARSLNNLLSRFEHAWQAEHRLKRTEEEIQRLVTAIDEAKQGKHPLWPANSGTSVDLLLSRIVTKEMRTPRNTTSFPKKTPWA
ncbi:hypothetical protein [Thermosporothrix hazakensis]|nr:hypothetical protein [Thermosporothrix hazakensis]